jgi:hypothetical protein
MAGAAVLGMVSLFVAWGQADGIEYGAPVRCMDGSGNCFESKTVVMGIGLVALLATIACLALAAILGLRGPRKGLETAFTGDMLAIIAVILYAVGLNNAASNFPVYFGFWLGLGMVVLAFIGPILMKGSAPSGAPAMQPRMMRPTGTPMATPMATPTAAGGMRPAAAPAAGGRRLKCPKCQSLFMAAAGQKPKCPNCGFGG